MASSEGLSCPQSGNNCWSRQYCIAIKETLEDGINPNSGLGLIYAALPDEIIEVLPSFCAEDRKLALVELAAGSIDSHTQIMATKMAGQIATSQALLGDNQQMRGDGL